MSAAPVTAPVSVVVPHILPEHRRKTVRIGGFTAKEVSLTHVTEGEANSSSGSDDVVASSIVVTKGGKKWRRTLFFAGGKETNSRKTIVSST